jgi:hypothetical protein
MNLIDTCKQLCTDMRVLVIGSGIAVVGIAGGAVAMVAAPASAHGAHPAQSAKGSVPAHVREPGFAFQPVTMQRIDLPKQVTEARWPVFTPDGHHILFWSGSELWIAGLDGDHVKCLTCGVANDPSLASAADMATPFPDGKRVFIDEDIQPGASKWAVLQCEPSLAECRHADILPVDYSAAEPPASEMQGGSPLPLALTGGAYHAKLSQDGRYVGFSVLRTDAIELMVVGRLQQVGDQYEVTDPRVINPPAPTSIKDHNTAAWSDSSGLFEFKTFTDGGADATYVEVGGPSLNNPDVWSVNLKTGKRTRLTAGPDWEEDNGISPNGKLMSLFSDRTVHYVDWETGLLPVPDFIDASASTAAAGALGGWSECMGPMWLLPSTGDDNGELAGQPLVDYRYKGVHVVDNLQGSAQWSPNGTMIALDTMDDPTGQAAPFLLVAHLTTVKPSKPLRTVASEPGNWAPTPAQYRGALGFNGAVTLRGPHGGTVTVHYGATEGALAGSWSEAYHHYSTDGRDFLTGSVTITGTALDATEREDLKLTGANTGSEHADLTFSLTGTTGHASSTYDGHTLTGPSSYTTGPEAKGGPSSACPRALPKEPALQVKRTRLANGSDRLQVTASVAGVGIAEAQTDTQPVNHAAITIGRKTVYTNGAGVATVTVRRGTRANVSAGDTLKGTSIYLKAAR